MFGFDWTRSKAKITALGALRSNVMLADNDLNITYMNQSLIVLMRDAESDLKKELPRFDMRTLIGSNIDIFHKNPTHQRTMLARLEKPHFATIRIGKRVFDLLVTPLMAGRRRNGFVVEWLNAEERLLNLEFRGQIAAMERSQAIIEFSTGGIIRRANENFLKVMGYRLEEIVGKHHSIFIEPAESRSAEYAKFWDDLAAGKSHAGEFKRLAKGGRAVWIQGVYNLVLDEKGQVTSVLKCATDISARIRAVSDVGTGLKALAAKNLQHRMTNAFTPEFEPLRLDFNASLENLEATMTSIAANTQGVRGGADEITQASDDLSRRTEQQAANLEETAAALDQITATVKKSAESAGEARQVVSSAKSDAERSGVVVNETVNAMNEIESSSKKISNIIGVIDEIAFQTNLLALNAGVEAARAGDAGRGFAVVATEVRALAQRSADAAKEIKALISTSSQQVDIGVKLVGETGKVLVNIARQVTRLSDLVGDIAASAQEQATGLGEVNSAVNQMDQVTQQNAAMVEQSTAASHSLTAEAEALNQLVSQFQIGAGGAAGGAGVRDQPAVRKAAPAPVVKSRIPVHAPVDKSRLNLATANAADWSEF